MSQNPSGRTPDSTPWDGPAGSSPTTGGPTRNVPAGNRNAASDQSSPGGTATQPPQQQTPRNPPQGQDQPRQQQPDLDPNLDGRAKGGASGATWVALIIGLIILILLLVFVLQNMNDVLIAYMAWEFSLPLGVAMLLAAIAGALIMAMAGSIRLIVVTRRLHKLEKERESIKRTLR